MNEKLPTKTVTASQVPVIQLRGTPKEIGQRWGASCKSAIHHDLEEYFLKLAREKAISPPELIDSSRPFVRIAEEVAPHWLTEARAIAEVAQIDPELYIAFIGTGYRSLFLGRECTSYSIARGAACDNAVFFHKTRDNVPRWQAAFVLQSALPGLNKFIAVSDASVIACMMMVNDKGLAGSADVGGLSVKRPCNRGVMNAHILRHIAETAGTCQEALAIVQKFVANHWYAGGAAYGTHWLFVDKMGRRLEIRHNNDSLEHQYHDEKVYFSRFEDTPAAMTLIEHEAPVSFCTFHNVSRDPSVCFDTSVSGMTVEIDPDCPQLLTAAWVCFPACSLAFPLVMGGTQTPVSLLDGTADAVSRHMPTGRTWLLEGVEQAVYRELVALKGKLKAEAGLKDAGEIARSIDSWVCRQTREHLELLKTRNG